MERKFFLNLLLLIFLNLLIKPFWFFGIEVGVQNAVGESAYGLYFILLNLTLVLNILLDIGITNYNNKNIAQHHFLLQKHLENIISIRILLGVLYAIIVYAIAFFLNWETDKIFLLTILIFNQFLSSFILYLRSNLSALHLFKTDSLISVLDRSLMIIIVGILLWGNVTKQPFKIEWFAYAQSFSYIITFLITLITVLNKSGKINIHFDWKFFIVFFKKSYPYALLILLMAFYNRFDSVMIDILLPNEQTGITEELTGHFQAGIYAQAFRILDVSSQFGYLFAALLLPIFSRMIKEKTNINNILQLSYTLIIVPAIIISIVVSIFSDDIINLLYTSNSNYSADILSILILGFIAIATTYIFGTLLTANGSLKHLNIMASIGILINLILNLIFIPKWNAQGAAYSSFITQTITALVQILIAKSIFKLRINYTIIIKLIILIVFVFFSSSFLKTHITNNWIAFVSSIFIATFFAFSFKLLSIKGLFYIVKNSSISK